MIFIVSTSDFTFYYKIGKGKFGYIYKVKDSITGRYCALKQMTKAKIIDKGLETIILQERFYIAKLNSPFVVNILCTFQDKNNLFILMELLTGGDLQFHILNYDYYFTETQLKFLMTNLILGIEYIHKKELIHCNLKPDNIMFDSHGFAKIIGFGDSCLKGDVIDEKLLNVDASEYMAPEVLDQEELDFTADFYSLGVIGYKLISGKDYNEEKDIDLTKDEKLKEKYSEFCLEFISKLLKKNKSKRLGSKEYENELKQHDFLMGMKWDLIKKGVFISPIIDIIKFSRINTKYNELFDYDLCNKKVDEPSPDELQNYMEIIEGESYPMYFQYYTCMKVKNIMRELNKDDNIAKDDYYFLAKDKQIKRSQSSSQISIKKESEINEKKHHHHHHHHHQHYKPKKKYENIYELPYITNKTEKEFRKREHKIKDYYENKLLKYKNHIKKLKNDNQIQYIQAKYIDQNHPIYKNFFPPSQRKVHQNRHLNHHNNYNNYNYESKRDNYLPPIPLPPPQREYKEMPNTMERVMARFYNQMSKDRNNFFIKFNKKNYFDNKNNDDSQYDDDYSSSESSNSGFEGKRSNNKLYDIPYINPNQPNVQYHNYFNKNEIKKNNMVPGVVKVEEYTETVESEESETTSIRQINGMKGRSIEKRSLSTMNLGNYDKYYHNPNEEMRSNKEEESEEEESEEEEEEDEEENEG